MKRITTLLAILLITVFFVACKKDYTCSCHVELNIPGFGMSSSDTTFIIEKTTKKKAKSQCSDAENEFNGAAQLLGGSGSCVLK